MPRIQHLLSVEPFPVTYTSQTKSLPTDKLASVCFGELSDNEAGDECWSIVGGIEGMLQIARKADESSRTVEFLVKNQTAGVDASDAAWFTSRALEIADSLNVAFFEQSMKRNHPRITMLHTLHICRTYTDIVFRVWAMSEVIESPHLDSLKANL